MIPGTLGHATIRKTRGLHWHNQKIDNIEQSMWFDGSSQYLTRTPSAGNRTRWTLAWWFKLNAISTEFTFFSANTGTNEFQVLMDPDMIKVFDDNASLNVFTPKLRDIGWYHCIISLDTAQTNEIERIQIYINGVKQDLTEGTAAYPSSSGETFWNNNQANEIGRRSRTTSSYTNAYMAQVVFLNGDSIQNGDCTVSDFLDTWPFGDNGSQFVPKKTSDLTTLASNAGGNSFCLDFADSSALGNDVSSNNNDFSDAGSPGAANQTSNTPSREYATFNTLVKSQNGFTLTNGNTKANLPSGGGFIPLTQLVQGNEKVYVEFVADDANNGNWSIGVADPSVDQDAAVRQSGIIAWESDGDKYVDASQTATDVRAWTDGAVMALALDMENRKLWIRDSTGWQGSGGSDDPTNSSTGVALPSSIGNQAVIIFGNSAGSFDQDCELKTEANSALTYAIPAGFKTLSTKDGTEPEYQGIDYFDSTLYEGNGAGQRVGDFVPFTDAYTVTNSVIFDDGDSRSLTLNSSATRTSATVAAYSIWVKRGNIVNGGTVQRPLTVQVDGNNYFGIHYNASDQLDFTINNGGATILQRITNRVFEDTASWHNIVVIINQADGTQADRVKIFYDGVQIPNTSVGFGTNTCSLDGSSALNFLDNSSSVVDIGGGSSSGFSQPFDGYIAEVVYLDGADSGGKLDASHFGQVDTSTNRWVAKDPGSYTFGNTGYYLEFKVAPGTSNGAGTDTSGGSNHFTSNGAWATTDQSNDAPSNNLAVLDSADTIGSATPALSQGNLTYTGADNGGRYVSGFPLTSGKWYWELELTTAAAFYPGFFTPAGVAFSSTTPWNSNSGSFLIAPAEGHWLGADGDGTKILYSAASGASPSGGPGAFISSGDRMFFAFDADNKYAYVGEVGSGGSGSTLTYYGRSGSVTGDPTSGEAGTGAAPFGLHLTGEDTFYFGAVSGGSSNSVNFLFDSTKWNGTPPTGYKALTQDNKDGADDKITAWSWIKNRDDSDNHNLVDRVRGVQKSLSFNNTSVEVDGQNGVQRFLQRGVQVGSGGEENTVNESHVLWQWLVGSSATTTTPSGGSIASTVAAADAGHFSVVGFTGATGVQTVAHGMGGAPEMMIFINREQNGANRTVYHKEIGATNYILLSSTAAKPGSGNSNYFNDAEPNSTVFTIGSGATPDTNGNGQGMIVYCFRSVPGVCSVGSYEGNNAADGTFVNLGFKPAWVMTKTIDATGAWGILDNKRDIDNPVQQRLFGNANSAEDTDGEQMDFLSNGFKLRKTGGFNNSNQTYIYLAMAEIAPNGAYPPIYGR